MKRVAIIGAGISGLSMARLLKESCHVTVFEKESQPGGLIRCERINGNLFHLCGGHVFNTKDKKVADWFWSNFDKEQEFIKAKRNSVIYLEDGRIVPYPIENNVFLLDDIIQKKIIVDWLNNKDSNYKASNFEDFLISRFGRTLYDLYFGPYNKKIWRTDLKDIPLEWLEGKLPMPKVHEMLYHNMNHSDDNTFVHSYFYYEKNGGSQFIADRFAKDIDIHYSSNICHIGIEGDGVMINDSFFDFVVFCGNIKQLADIFSDIIPERIHLAIDAFKAHGTTAVLCELEENPYSWIYQPSGRHESHRIICTGNFSPTNNPEGICTGTVEFTDEIQLDDIKENLRHMPFSPRYLTHHYSKYSYPIQDKTTRTIVKELKNFLSSKRVFMSGRFADWEYYNMDAAIGAAMRTADFIQKTGTFLN